MDAASCFILGSEFVPADESEPDDELALALALLEKCQSHKGSFPNTLIISDERTFRFIAREAERQKITVTRVPENELLVFIGDARNAFKKFLE